MRLQGTAHGKAAQPCRAGAGRFVVIRHDEPVGWSRRVAAGLLVVLTAGGWVGGISFLADPSGGLLGMSPLQLPHWPLLRDYTAPGVLLIVLFGVLPVLALLALVRRPQVGWRATAAVGVVLVVWMLVQIVALGLLLPGMQLAFLAIGTVLLALAVISAPRRHRRAARPDDRSPQHRQSSSTSAGERQVDGRS